MSAVLRVGKGGSALAAGSELRCLVHIPHRHRNIQHPRVLPVRGPHRNQVFVVAVGVGGTFVVRCIPESQHPGLADAEVPAVGARQAPGEGGAGTFRVAGRVGPTEVLVILVNRAGVQSAHRRRFVDRCDCHGYVQRGGVKSIVLRPHRHQVLITVGPGRTLIVGRTPERQRARLADPEFISVWPSHRPGNTASLRVRGPVGVQARRPVVRLPQPGRGRARGGDGRRLVHGRYRDDDVQGTVGIPVVVGPHHHQIFVVPVRVRRPFIVRCIPEGQHPGLADEEVPAVGPRQAPAGYAVPLRICCEEARSRQFLVLLDRVAVPAGYRRPLIHVGDGNRHGKCGGVELVVLRLHQHVVYVVPA